MNMNLCKHHVHYILRRYSCKEYALLIFAPTKAQTSKQKMVEKFSLKREFSAYFFELNSWNEQYANHTKCYTTALPTIIWMHNNRSCEGIYISLVL